MARETQGWNTDYASESNGREYGDSEDIEADAEMGEANTRFPDTQSASDYADDFTGNGARGYEMPQQWIDRGNPNADLIMQGLATREMDEPGDNERTPWNY